MFRWLLRSPLALAVLVTVANAAKPVTVDDTAYLIFARHIATNPADPYGFSIFWRSYPEPAMAVLCPPLMPYWLASGLRLFGESPALLKLWLFPFVYVLAWALRALLARFARGYEAFALPLLMLSPAVLPTVNLMLDVPAVALALASVELFARGCLVGPPSRGGRTDTAHRGTTGIAVPLRSRHLLRTVALAALAGLVAALAMQTKYSAFGAPAAILWYGFAHRHLGRAAVAVGACAALFVGWELWVAQKCGQSHFWYHVTATADGAPPEGRSKLSAFLDGKLVMLLPLVSYLGCLAVGAGLLAASALRVSRRWLVGLAVAWCAGFALVALLPRRWTLIEPDLAASTVFWNVSGWVWLVAVAGCAAVLVFRVKKGLGFRSFARAAPGVHMHAGLRGRSNSDSLFLVGWLAIEVGAAVALTPFPAARRVFGVALVMGLLAARAASRISRARPTRRPPHWVLGVGVGAGVVVAAIDTLDAFPEKVCADRTAELTRDRPATSTVWYVGHWGFQYYCERAGMRPLIPNGPPARAGDFVVLPVYPDEEFNRPHVGFGFAEPVPIADAVAEFVCDDRLSAKTVPNFYGGLEPVAGRDHPRLRVRVYRLRRDWEP